MASASARSSGRRGGVLRSAWGLRMRKEAGAAAPAVRVGIDVLDDVNRRLLASLWTRETLLRGSMARGSADSESDIDLVAVTADAEFETALRDLTSELPQFLPGRLPPWLDGIVRDFGGMGFVYLLRISEHKWGQLDIYLLPQSRKQQLLDNEFALALQCDGGIKPFAKSRHPGLFSAPALRGTCRR